MRVIKIELPAAISAVDSSISLASDEIRMQLFGEFRAFDSELNEAVRQRAKSYFPESFSVFVRTLLVPDRLETKTEMWIVDPTVQWPAGLLTRRAWTLFIPILAHVVRESMAERFPAISFDVKEAGAHVEVMAPTRAWYDPTVVGIVVFLLTTVLWVYLVPRFLPALSSLFGS